MDFVILGYEMEAYILGIMLLDEGYSCVVLDFLDAPIMSPYIMTDSVFDFLRKRIGYAHQTYIDIRKMRIDYRGENEFISDLALPILAVNKSFAYPHIRQIYIDAGGNLIPHRPDFIDVNSKTIKANGYTFRYKTLVNTIQDLSPGAQGKEILLTHNYRENDPVFCLRLGYVQDGITTVFGWGWDAVYRIRGVPFRDPEAIRKQIARDSSAKIADGMFVRNSVIKPLDNVLDKGIYHLGEASGYAHPLTKASVDFSIYQFMHFVKLFKEPNKFNKQMKNAHKRISVPMGIGKLMDSDIGQRSLIEYYKMRKGSMQKYIEQYTKGYLTLK